ncbi:2-hydroxymuconic semialdehyde dehydrogenase [Novosphingobium profundi]|uniref:2-hydroxymuconic semialdehyde dehydrogenase n=1 Tax=Novosphingobium profundi TaxID=1774954 RepID=UPI001BD97D1D|nr:2-hydroxymuconic semialdehyde dehydrogenase [Novosphingobium profundi]MBT0670108.1 2-hydroxymuconic semialdehyde dehydrogenase [Novosphingobium profundi]
MVDTPVIDKTAAARAARFRHFIDGEMVESADGRMFEKRRPFDNSLVGMVSEAGRAEVDAAVMAARNALNGPWKGISVEERSDMMRAVADGINKRFDDFVEAEFNDTGQPKTMMSHAFVPRGAANFKSFADVVKSVAGEAFQTPTPDGAGAINYSIRKPKGVIGVISPWNAPFLLMTWKVAPALACGNTVVVKPSEETPGTATLLGEVMNDVGIPKGVYNVVHGFGPESAGAFLTEHPEVDAITFTGETRTGTAIMKAAAVGTRDVSFEMGGKNSALVFADADIDKAVEGLTRSIFLNCGQVCLGTERVLVERPIFDEVVARMKAVAESLRPGHPEDKHTNFGPLISQEHRDKVLSYYAKAKAEGATIVTGGGVPDLPGDLAKGSWVQPTIWTGLADDASPVREEIFGPCCHIRPFDSEGEAVRVANDTEYGLATSIWTSDLSRAHRVAQEIDVGITWVNSWFLRDLRTPFGGSKQSGIGREGGVHSLEFYTELRNICVKL